MRDALALALVRAEMCRVHAAERPRIRRTGWRFRPRAIIERTLRSIRPGSRTLVAAHAALSENAAPPD